MSVIAEIILFSSVRICFIPLFIIERTRNSNIAARVYEEAISSWKSLALLKMKGQAGRFNQGSASLY